MKIIIVGIGKIGLTLAHAITAEGHDVVLVDNDPQALSVAKNSLDVNTVEGNGATMSVLEEAGAARADLLIASSSTDEINILICLVARKLGTKRTVARVRDPEYAKDLYKMTDELGLSMILNPEQSAAEEILRSLKYPSAIKIDTFAKGKVSLVEFKIDGQSPLLDLKISSLHTVVPIKILVCAIVRGDKVLIPRGNDVITEGDIIYVTASNRQLYSFFKAVGRNKNRLKDVMILGGGKIGFYLAEDLCEIGAKVTIIERNHDRCKELSDLLPKASVICGDGTDHMLLKEEGIEGAEGVVSLTGIDEENIIISVFAASCGVGKVITKVNRENLLGMVGNMGLESIVTPARLTADRVVGYIRALSNSDGSQINTLYKLVGGRVEAVEFQIDGTPDFIGVPLSRLNIKKNLLVVSIIRNGKILFPGGSDWMDTGDRVIVVTADRTLTKLEDILE